MDDAHNLAPPAVIAAITQATADSGFSMASDIQTGSLLRTLAATKPGGAFLELGTGTGLSTAWILAGMDVASTLVSVDNDSALQSIALKYLGQDRRVSFQLADGDLFLESLIGHEFDFIFADTWPGKYMHLEVALGLLKPGGLYIIDDMLPQTNWPPGHEAKAYSLIAALEARVDLTITKLGWATGLIVGAKIA